MQVNFQDENGTHNMELPLFVGLILISEVKFKHGWIVSKQNGLDNFLNLA